MDCIEASVVGVDNLELHLRRSHLPQEEELKPAPIKFDKQSLNRVHKEVDLRAYDALLFEGKTQTQEASKAREEDDTTNSNAADS